MVGSWCEANSDFDLLFEIIVHVLLLADNSRFEGNFKDDTDHPAGVWSLPPTYSMGETNRADFTAIGESDRMTLKFKKPRI